MFETYTVRRGDTLSAIASRYGTTVNELVRLNNIANPNLIFPGQVLNIREIPATGDAVTYTVVQGDTLSAIAARYGTTVAELVRLNNIANQNLIFPGQVLVIREGASTPPENTIAYTVVRGDTLSAIAARYGTTAAELARINNIANPNLIFPGQVLFVPDTAPPTQTVTYTVVRGDTLSAIAARYGTTAAELARINNISNPNLIFPGQVLIIRTGTTPPGGQVTYTVVRGDTLSAIAARYGTTVAELVRLNNITNQNRIFPGQVLVIREGTTLTHTVVPGDTLSAIAARYGTTVAELVRLNNIADANRIFPGQVLVIR